MGSSAEDPPHPSGESGGDVTPGDASAGSITDSVATPLSFINGSGGRGHEHEKAAMIHSLKPREQADLPVAVDAMGGDLGFGVQVEGAVQAFKEFGVRSILVGPENELRGKLAAIGAAQLPIQVKHAPEVITMDDSPARAVRRKPDSSLCVAYRLVFEGQASAVLSSGNSGAMMAAGRMICGFLPGIERPAIATLIPVAGNARPNVILDAGANVECDAQNLVQFALMGAIYYSSLFDIERPRIALLSNGTEASKGTDTIRGASLVLSKMENVNFIGYVEGRDVVTDAADVVVCDGFVGNVLLKAMEGCVRLFYKQIVHDAATRLTYKLGLFLTKGMFRKVFHEKFDYANYGGAPLLGLSKLSIVLHGSSDARAVKNAIRMARSFAGQGMTEKITAALTQLDERFPSLDSDILAGVFGRGGELPSKSELRSQESDSRGVSKASGSKSAVQKADKDDKTSAT